MKKLALYLAVSILCSCTGKPRTIPAQSSISVVDLTPYSNQGFLITPYGYSGEYEAIGLFQAVAMPSASLEMVNTGERSASGDTVYEKSWQIGKVNTGKSIDSLFVESKKLGADAIIDLKIEQLIETIPDSPPATLYGFRISGFAIKRKTKQL